MSKIQIYIQRFTETERLVLVMNENVGDFSHLSVKHFSVE